MRKLCYKNHYTVMCTNTQLSCDTEIVIESCVPVLTQTSSDGYHNTISCTNTQNRYSYYYTIRYINIQIYLLQKSLYSHVP